MTAQGPSALPRFSGVVVHGNKRGRVIGFPTANIALSDAAALADDGVYSCWVKLPASDALHGATVSVGRNPTFDDVHDRRVEAYIHDLDATLYGLTLEFFIVHRLRDMVRFASINALIEQTEKDVKRSRNLLGEAAPSTLGKA